MSRRHDPEPPRSTGLFYDLTHIKFRYVMLVLACLATGSYLRNEIFSGDIVDDMDSARQTDSFLRVQGPDHWGTRQKQNARLIANLAQDTTPQQAIAALGAPQFRDTYANNIEVLYYRTNHEHSDSYTTRDETTPLVYIDGKLVSHDRPAHGPAFSKSSSRGSDHWRSRQQENANAIAAMQPGEQRLDVIAKLGRPDFDDIITPEFEVLSYRTHAETPDGETSRSETTPLIFQTDKLIGIGMAGTTLPAPTDNSADSESQGSKHEPASDAKSGSF